MIKYNSIEYFILSDLNDKLKNTSLDKLDLLNLDRLRNEVEMKILASYESYKQENCQHEGDENITYRDGYYFKRCSDCGEEI